MENRRPTTPNTPKPFNRRDNFPKPAPRTGGFERPQINDRDAPPRTDKFQRNVEKSVDKNGKSKFLNNRQTPPPQNRRPPARDKKFKPVEIAERPPLVSELQITDGRFFGKYLQIGASPKIRTTARRVREVMFKILQRRVRAGRFLDLCAGAGTVGIEAISRGALIGTFVERSAKMSSLIKKNLKEFNIKDGHGEVFEAEAVPFLKQMEKRRRVWDVCFLDPPPDADYDEILAYFSRGAALKPRGVLVVKHPEEMFFPENIGVLHRWRVVVDDETALSFYERK